jgi:hypothetical protein
MCGAGRRVGEALADLCKLGCLRAGPETSQMARKRGVIDAGERRKTSAASIVYYGVQSDTGHDDLLHLCL